MAENKETFRDKLRNLLNRNKVTVAKAAPVTTDKVLISHEFWLDIGASSPLEQRLEKIKEATKLVESELLQDSVTKRLWIETKDLLQPKMCEEVRLVEFAFMRSIIKGQYRKLGILRAVFFQALQDHPVEEDDSAAVLTFETLSDNGKDIALFEQEVGHLLLTWMKRTSGNPLLLSLFVNIIKFNSSYLDQEVIVEALLHVCGWSNKASQDKEKEQELALKVVDAVICYSSLPHESLYAVTVMLCRILNLQKFLAESWKLMKKLLGTHLGHSCISTMCHILQNPKKISDWPLLRSAVFFIGMGLWGSASVKSLKHTPQSVLPSFQCALRTKNLELAFEVTLTIQRLVRKFGHELQAGTWDHVLEIVETLLQLVEESDHQLNVPAATSLKSGTHELITFIEKLYSSDAYDGSVPELFAITEKCCNARTDESVFLLIAYKSQAISRTKENWVSNLEKLLDKFYLKERRSSVRLRTIEVLKAVVEASMEIYEEELVSVLSTCFAEIHSEKDVVVKTSAISLIVHATILSGENCLTLLGILENALMKGWNDRVRFSVSGPPRRSFSDSEELAFGFVEIFKDKMMKYPGTHAARAFSLLTSFLQRFYSMTDVTAFCECLAESRRVTFELILSLRANEKKQLSTCQVSDSESFTSYLLCGEDDLEEARSAGIGVINHEDVMECVLLSLKSESHWPVLQSLLAGLCGLFQNKSIVIGCARVSLSSPSGQDYPRFTHLEELTNTLCSLMTDSVLSHRKISGLPPDITRVDIQSSVLSVLSCLVSYHRWLDTQYQRQILRCLESGFTTRCARPCIAALTVCLAEMPRKTLLRVLPSVLLRLSQMSATVHMATAVLELLATLAQLPGLYSNFVEDQYMSVFAVALQYTNPSKFSKYVVSLAHYVVGTWFTKCRMSFRPDFVSFITRNLHAANRRGAHGEDGSDFDAIRNDLMETCIDTMARYTFSNCSTPPRRSPLARFLFDNGPSCTWLIGNRLITVTTSSADVNSSKMHLPQPPTSLSTPSFTFWPKPSRKYFDRQMSSEAPGKLQSAGYPEESSSTRQRHKSGGAVLKRTLHLSPCEARKVNSSDVEGSTKKHLAFGDQDPSEPRISELKCMLTQGWAEVFIRRPSGNTAWSLRIQNDLACLSENSNIEELLNLQSIFYEIGTRTEMQKLSERMSTPLPTQLEEKDEESPSPYMDLLTSRKGSTPSATPPDTVSPEQTPPGATHADPISTPPTIRQRSHTVSTSRDCAAEAAAISAKRASELRRSNMMATKDKQRRNVSPGLIAGVSDSLRGKSGYGRETHDTSSHRHNLINSPCFVFLQLFQSAISSKSIHRPILLPVSPGIERAIQVLDRIPPYDTWATGVVYVGAGQGSDGPAILSNERGSPRYEQFLHGLGELVCLNNCDPSSTFLSALDTSGEDGDFTYVWKQDVAQMVFDVTTLMPNKSGDAGCKRKHIGNDYVIIAYDDDNGKYVPGCVVQGQFRSAEVIVTPLDHETNHVRYAFHRDCVEKSIGSTSGPWLVSDQTLPILVRQLALHANMAAFVCIGQGSGAGEYTSKVLARLKHIKRIRTRAVQETDIHSASNGLPKPAKDNNSSDSSEKLEEFSDYVG